MLGLGLRKGAVGSASHGDGAGGQSFDPAEHLGALCRREARASQPASLKRLTPSLRGAQPVVGCICEILKQMPEVMLGQRGFVLDVRGHLAVVRA